MEFSADMRPESQTTPFTDGGASDDELRAHTYSLLATLLNKPPAPQTLELLRRIRIQDGGADGAMGRDWCALKIAAERSEPGALDDEYHALFVGITLGEVVPYACWYLSGCLMDKPLVRLRQDLSGLGLERRDGVHEPEDHAGVLCETMALLCFTPDEYPATVQREFFNAHIGPWMGAFFHDVRDAPSADFYQAVGRLGGAFIELEGEYLAMPA